ncbi:hypothetical protein PIB30_092428 [Stylosanthes scabra]|uniref:Uncharacterized protein n=1 Tax=Stylosanthes scabra TaxID=79078 RepID=A0ABU6XTZ4_9FABA|nr:hypothetical protein [Stylosanthes scabra]
MENLIIQEHSQSCKGILMSNGGLNLIHQWPIQKRKKSKRKLGKQEKRKTELQEQNKVLKPRRHYPCLGVAELTSPFSPIQHSTPRRDARHLGVDGVARKLALHQGLNAWAWTQNA